MYRYIPLILMVLSSLLAGAQPPNGGPVPYIEPIVITASATSITSTSAVLGGNITTNGDNSVIERGVMYSSTHTSFNYGYGTWQGAGNGSGTGTYSQTIVGLTPGTTYYVRAYARTSVGYTYGATVSFTTVNPAPVITLSSGNAVYTLDGSDVQVDGGITITDANSTMLTGSTVSVNKKGGEYLNFINQNGVTGSYNTSTGILTISGTASLAVYQAALRSIKFEINSYTPSMDTRTVTYTVNDGTYSSAPVTKNITINAAPTVTTTTPSSITSTTAVLGGNVTADGGAGVNSRGVVYSSTNTSPTLGTASADDYFIGTGGGTYSGTLYSLKPGTIYYVRAFATNSAGTSYGATLSFTTVNSAPVITLNSPNAVYTLGGSDVQIDGGVTITDVDNTALTGATVTITNRQPASDLLLFINRFPITGSYNISTGVLTLSGQGSIAEYTAALRSIEFHTYGTSTDTRIITFTVSDGKANSATVTKNITVNPAVVAPTVTTAAVTGISTTSATIGGEVTADGNAVVTNRGMVYSLSNTSPIIGGTNVTQDVNGSGISTYSKTIAGLAPGTTYYVRAYATNSAGTSYGTVQTFTTQTIVVSLVEADASPTNAAKVRYTLTFATPVTGLTLSNFSIATSGLIGVTLTSVSGSGTTYTVAVNTGSGSGTLQLNLANNTSLTPVAANLPFKGDIYLIDKNSPAATISTAVPSGSTTAAPSIPFTTTFSESVTGFEAKDITVSNGIISGFSGSGTTYNFNVTPSADGLVSVSVPPNAALDAAGNANTAAAQYTFNYAQPVTAAPFITEPANNSVINTAAPSFKGTAPAGSTVTVYVDDSPTGNPIIANASGEWTLTQPIFFAAGAHRIYATATLSGNKLSVKSNINTFYIDLTSPTAVISSTAAASGESTGSLPIPFKVIFSEAVTTITSNDIIVTSGTVNGFSGSGDTYTFNVTPSANGEVTVSVPANIARDVAGNGNTASGIFNVTYLAPPALAASGKPAALSNTYGTPSANTTLNVSGTNLTAGIVVTPPRGFEVSTNATTGFTGSVTVGTAGNVSLTPIYLRLVAAAPVNTYSGNVTLTSTSAPAVNIAVNGRVSAATLNVTAVDESKIYDGTAYSGGNGLNYNGFVNNQDTSVLSGTLTYTGSAQGAINTGSYVITPAGLSAPNYTLRYNNGKLTISRQNITAVTKPAAISAAFGTAFTGLTLPATVVVTFNNGKTGNLPITWLAGNYNGNAAGTYTLTGNLTTDANTSNTPTLAASIDVLVNAKNITAIAAQAPVAVDYATTAAALTAQYLPATVNVTYNNGSNESLQVTWGTANYDGNKAGVYRLTGNVTPAAGTINTANLFAAMSVTVNKGTAVITADALQPYVYNGAARPVTATLNHLETSLTYSPQQSYTEVGSFPVMVTAAATANYNGTTKNVILQITPATTIGVRLADASFVYDGTAKSLAVTGLPAGSTVTYVGNGQTAVGTYNVTATVKQANYNDLVLNSNLTITPATITGITLADASFIYDGTAKSLAATSLPSGATMTYTGNGQTTVGTHNVTATVKRANYTDQVLEARLTIIPATITGVTLADASFVYDGTARSLAVTGLPVGATVTYTGNGQTDVGAYNVTATVKQANYNNLTLTRKLTITPATFTSVTLADQSYAYDGTAKSLAVTGQPTGATVIYTGNGQTTVGTYNVASIVKRVNYNDLVLNGKLTITPAIITGVTLANQSYVYDGTAKSLVVTGLPAGATVTYTGNGQTTVGTYNVTSTVKQANYNDLVLNGKLTITPAIITGVTLANQSFVYDGTAKSLVVIGLPAGATVIYTGNGQTSVGIYDITAVIKTVNYNDQTLTGKLTITPAAIPGVTFANQTFTYDATPKSLVVTGLPTGAKVTYTGNSQINANGYVVTAKISRPNYNDIILSANLTINKAVLTITANNQTKVYGQANPKLMVSYSGFVAGESPASLSTAAIATTIANTSSLVGNYPITVNGAAASNYTINHINGTLAITPASNRTVTFNGPIVKTYGDADFNAGARVSTEETVIYSSANTAVATIVNGNIHIVGAGSTVITATAAANSNYTGTPAITQTLTVDKATQRINFASIPNQIRESDFDLGGVTASSGLPVTITSANPQVAVIQGQRLRALRIGSARITASQAGNANYYPAANEMQALTVIDAQGNEVIVHQAVSPNGDGINDYLYLEGVQNYPYNRVTVVNRNGVKVFEITGYDNADRKFEGRSNVNGQLQQPGTYFYQIQYVKDGKGTTKNGWFVLKY
jgi:gliding motility-associated-like protein